MDRPQMSRKDVLPIALTILTIIIIAEHWRRAQPIIRSLKKHPGVNYIGRDFYNTP